MSSQPGPEPVGRSGSNESASAGIASPTGRTAWARNLAAPLRDFLSTETGGAAVLLCATVAAIAWANSPWSESYESLWTTTLSIRLGSESISMDLRHWVNEGLMTLFFLVVGLEAKRELDLGALRERRRIAIPVVAAAGGMALPVLIYLAFNAGGAGADGWGAAMSTDTAFALGVLSLVAPGGTRLRVRLLTLAVIDDLVALVVIATAYTEHVRLVPLAVAVGLFCLLFPLRYAPNAWRRQAAAVLGVAVWVALFESGIDPILAGLAVGLVTSAYPPARTDLERVSELTRSVRDLRERAAPVQASPVDELRDRAAVRARERGHPRRRAAARRRRHFAHNARNPVRLSGGQAAWHPQRVVACIAALVRRAAPGAELADDRRGRGGRQHRVHGLAADLEPRLRGAAARRGEARRARRGGAGIALGLGRVPHARAAASRGTSTSARGRRRR